MKPPFKIIGAQQRCTTNFTAIMEFMDDGYKLIKPGTITRDKFREHLQIIWYLLVLSFIDKYGKDMVLFYVRQAINDVETNTFQAYNTTNWPIKVLDHFHDGSTLPPVTLYTANFSGLLQQA